MSTSRLVQVEIDGTVVPVTFRWHHWIPTVLFSGATTLGPHTVAVKRGPTDTIRPAPIVLAHELVHVAQAVRMVRRYGPIFGRLCFWMTALWQVGRYWTKANRPIEAQAYREQEAVLAKTHPTIRIVSDNPWGYQ